MPGSRSLLRGDPVNSVARTNNQAIVENRRRCHRELVKRIRTNDLKIWPCFDNVCRAFFAEREDLAVLGPRRRCEPLAHNDPLSSIDLFTRPRVVAGHESTVKQSVVVVAVDEGRRMIGTTPRQ